MSPTDAVPLRDLLVALACAAVGSVFAAADAALGSISTARLSALHKEAKGAHEAALARYVADPERRHSRWLVGRVVFTSLSAVLTAMVVQPALAGRADWAIAPVGALGALASYGALAEVATTLARGRANFFALHVVGWLRPLELLVLPLALPLAWLGSQVARALGAHGPADVNLSETEVAWAVTEGQKSGSLAPERAEMIRNVLELKDRAARDVMVPRTHMSAIDVASPLASVLDRVSSEGHSRYPVYRDSIDNVVGLLYAKDLFRAVRAGNLSTTPLGELVRGPANFVSEAQGLSVVLREMRARRQHMAVVVDEFGGVSGLITLEDVLEEIVGDIRDEHDTDDGPVQDLGGGRLLADAAVSLLDLSSYLGTDIEVDGDFESLGGLLTHHAGRVPAVGTRIELLGLAFIVREADEKRISRVEIVRPADGSSRDPAPLSRRASR